jgi:hypothetical protein
MTPALRNFFALIVAIAAITAVNLARYSSNGTGWAWASVIIGIGALTSGLYLLFRVWRSKA